MMSTKNTKDSTLSKYFLPYDIYERHKFVGSLIENGQTVVDIGGELNLLSQFCRPAEIIVANLTSGDIIIKKNKIPFKKKSFDVVTSIDVLEHLPKTKRKDFISRLLEIAKKRLILSFPIGTPKHIAYEKKSQNLLKKMGVDVRYLKEHILYGLPTTSEIVEYSRDFNTKIYYSGNINVNKLLFNLFIFDPKVKFLRKCIYFSKLFFNLITNPIWYRLLTFKKYSDSVNRAYMVIEKSNP